jgi:SagB-type dehydrogenase family enzyme
MKKPFRLLVALGVVMVSISSGFAADQPGEIKLPKPAITGKLSVEAAMLSKKSVRSFASTPLTAAQISQILWAANGNLPTDAITSATSKVFPSAGGLYPLEAFLVCGQNTVEGVPAGVYRYNPMNNSLQQVTAGDNRKLLAAASMSQMFIAQAPASVIVAAVFERMTGKYGPRGMNYVFMEAGSSNQNIFLQAESLGLKIASVGAFQDAQVAAALKLPSGITPLLVIPVGK